jgi:hypothetical protein
MLKQAPRKRAQRRDNSGKIGDQARENGPIPIGAMRNGR